MKEHQNSTYGLSTPAALERAPPALATIMSTPCTQNRKNGKPILMKQRCNRVAPLSDTNAELLAAKHQVFAPDLPGHGESDKPEHALPVLEQAELLKGWLQENRLERICVVANSYGCAIAVELAIMAPDVVTDIEL